MMVGGSVRFWMACLRLSAAEEVAPLLSHFGTPLRLSREAPFFASHPAKYSAQLSCSDLFKICVFSKTLLLLFYFIYAKNSSSSQCNHNSHF
jgi:hypothetical protein